MRKLVSTILVLSVVALAGCASEKPLSEAEQAAQYGMTVQRYREEKAAAARMNMKFEDHMKTMMGDGMQMDHGNMQ